MKQLSAGRHSPSRKNTRKFSRALHGLALGWGAAVMVEATPRWFPGPPAPLELDDRAWLGMVYDSSRHRVVLFGGNGPQASYLSDTWEYDGTAWTAGPAAPAGLLPRVDHAMAFDAWRGRTVLFGGQGTAYVDLGDTWEYDGTAWRPGAAAPPALLPRLSAAMAFDGRRGRVVLAGGMRTYTYQLLADVWEYDGVGWTSAPSLPAAMGPRGGARLAFHPSRGTLLMVAGYGVPDYRTDTWQFDGGAWTLVDPGQPDLSRSHAAMAYDEGLGRMVLHGGRFDRISYGDVWELQGTGWQEEPMEAGPSGRAFHGMTFDEARGRLVLYGGRRGDDYPTDRTPWERAEEDDSYVTGQGLAFPNPNKVRLFDAAGLPGIAFLAYGARQWGVNVASAVVFAEGRGDILTGPGPGAVYGPQVRGFRRDGAPRATVNFYAYGTLRYGVNVAGSDVDADGYDEIVTGAGPATVFGPHVRGWEVDGSAARPVAGLSFFAYGALTYGVAVAGAQVVADHYFAHGEILTGAGPGPTLGPHVRGFYRSGYYGQTTTPIPGLDFFAFPAHQFGVQVGGGDVDGDATEEVACAPGPGPALDARFRGFDFAAATVSALPGYDAFPYPTFYGVRLALGDLDGDQREELVTGAGPDPWADATVKTFSYDGTALVPSPVSFVAFTSYHGVNVSTGALAP